MPAPDSDGSSRPLDKGSSNRFCIGLLSGLLSTTALADTLLLQPVRDNTLYESAEGSLSNGQGKYLFAGRTAQTNNQRRRALLLFDVAAAVPAGSTIKRAILLLHMSRTLAGSHEIGLHRILADWGEGKSDAAGEEGNGTCSSTGDATWLHRFSDTVQWSKPGGDFTETASAKQIIGGNGDYLWDSDAQGNAGMVTDVQTWLDMPAGNAGWLLLGDEAGAADFIRVTAKRFDSRSYPDVFRQPHLILIFNPPAGTTLSNATFQPGDNILQLPQVSVPTLGNFSARLQLQDSDTLSFALMNATPISNTLDAATSQLNLDTGKLLIPLVAVSDSTQGNSWYMVEMQANTDFSRFTARLLMLPLD